MQRSRYSDEQIIGILNEHQTKLGEKKLCCKHGVSDATFYKLRSKYGGMEVSEAKKFKALEADNAKLTKLLAEQMMDITTLNEMSGNKCQARLTQKRDDLRNQREGIQSEACECLG